MMTWVLARFGKVPLQFSRESRDFEDAFPPHIDWDRPFGAQNESEYAK